MMATFDTHHGIKVSSLVCSGLVWSLGISTIVAYLMPNKFYP